MARKKFFLIAFGALTSFSVLAGNMTHTTAPTVEPVAIASDVSAIQIAEQPLPVAPTTVAISTKVVAAPLTQVVTAATLSAAPVEDKVVEAAEAEPNVEPVPATETIAIEHQNQNGTDGIVAIGGQMLQSVWIDVPNVLFRNVSFPGAIPEPLAKAHETVVEVSPVSNTGTNANRHILTGEIARPSTNFIYRDEKLGVQLSKSLLPLDSIQSTHSASLRGASSVFADSKRTLGTLSVITESSHFGTSSRNFTDKLFQNDREVATASILPGAMIGAQVTSNTVAVLEPVFTNQIHFDSQNVTPLGLGVSVTPGERNEVADLMASLSRASIVEVPNIENDRLHNAEAFQRNSNRSISNAIVRNDGTLALGIVEGAANVSSHTKLAANSIARMPDVLAFVRESNASLLGSSIVVPALVKADTINDSSAVNTSAGFSIPEFAIAANNGLHQDRVEGYGNSAIPSVREVGFSIREFAIAENYGSHQDRSDDRVTSSTASSREGALSILSLNSDPKFAERSHESTFARNVSSTPVFAVETTANNLFVEPASNNSITEHANPMVSLSGVYADSKTAGLFAANIDKSFVVTEQQTAAPIANNAAVENKTASAATRKPVLIDGKTAMSHEMIAPMTSSLVAVVDDVPAFAGPVRGGPSVDLLAGATSSPAKLESSTKASASSPVLISGKTEFSADLLKPMNSKSAALTIPGVAPKPTKVTDPNASASVPTAPPPGYCDASFVGDPIRFSQTVELRLDDLLTQLHSRFGINFIMGPNIGKLPINVKAGSIPWNVLLRSQLFISGVRARCIDENTIELVENSLLPNLQDGAAVSTRFVKLKYLQRTNGGTVDSANRLQGSSQGGGGCGGSVAGGSGGSSGGSFGGGGGGQGGEQAGQQASSRFDRLVEEIEKVLGLRSMSSGTGNNGNSVGSETEEVRANRSVTQIPGRNILVITATEEEHKVVDQIIALADRPPFQVLVKGLIYGANQDRLLDLGTQTTITGGNAAGDIFGGITGMPVNQGGTIFDFSAVVGTFQFNTQFTALEQKGVLTVKSRPFTTVIDGLCTMLNVGKELPIVIDNNQIGGTGDVVFVNAANNLAITPYVIDDDNGKPVAVTLELRLEANDVDSSVTTRGVPAISKRSVQTQLLLGKDKTAILGGFTVDQDSKTVFKTPGLGDIPIIGELFKRRVRDTRTSRLYFAITATVIEYPDAINPVNVPGATTDIQNITPDMKKRADEAEKTPAKKSKDN